MCIRVGLSQTKKGLLSLFDLSMNLIARSRIVSSTVSMLCQSCIHGMRRQRAFVFDFLLADFAPARHLGGIVGVGGEGVDEVARANDIQEILGIVGMKGSSMASR